MAEVEAVLTDPDAVRRTSCDVSGGLAQLGERLAGSQKVRGSSPLSSTRRNRKPFGENAKGLSHLSGTRIGPSSRRFKQIISRTRGWPAHVKWHTASSTNEPHDLASFLRAQEDCYDAVFSELKDGHKQSHWMWYVFPQFDGLGFSPTSKQYSIKSTEEADAYLRHTTLGPRLRECVEVLLGLDGRSSHDIFGSPDDSKLRSCATLFALVSPSESLFERLLEKYFDGQRDDTTLRLVGNPRGMGAANDVPGD